MKSIRIVAISIFVLIQSVSVFAGGVRGLIKGDDGAPLPYSTIFVKQTGTGSASDLQGRYEVMLSPGGAARRADHAGGIDAGGHRDFLIGNGDCRDYRIAPRMPILDLPTSQSTTPGEWPGVNASTAQGVPINRWRGPACAGRRPNRPRRCDQGPRGYRRGRGRRCSACRACR